SGPTVADPTTFADAARVLGRWLDPAAVPAPVRARFEAGCTGQTADTPKGEDPLLARVEVRLIGSNRTAVAAAAAEAGRRGYGALVLDDPLTGDAVEAARTVLAALGAAPRDRPAAVIAGGETTVRVVPGGCGGRAQHLALAAALALAGTPAVLLAAG